MGINVVCGCGKPNRIEFRALGEEYVPKILERSNKADKRRRFVIGRSFLTAKCDWPKAHDDQYGKFGFRLKQYQFGDAKYMCVYYTSVCSNNIQPVYLRLYDCVKVNEIMNPPRCEKVNTPGNIMCSLCMFQGLNYI